MQRRRGLGGFFQKKTEQDNIRGISGKPHVDAASYPFVASSRDHGRVDNIPAKGEHSVRHCARLTAADPGQPSLNLSLSHPNAGPKVPDGVSPNPGIAFELENDCLGFQLAVLSEMLSFVEIRNFDQNHKGQGHPDGTPVF